MTIPASIITLTRLQDLRVGDRIHRIGTRIIYNPPRTVRTELAPLVPDHPVYGVRLAPPEGCEVEYVLYPASVDGLEILIER